MVAIEKILFAALGMTAVHAAGINSPCPNNQSLISNDKCCPGISMVESDATYCCVTDPNRQINGDCKAKVSIDDPDYDQKVNDALGTASSSTSTSSPAATSTSASATSSDSASGSSTATDSTATSSGTAASATDNAAAGARDATLGMVAALAAVPVVFYAL
ncbi:hypothetical protein F4820DRAFT_401008 [Hypoxylon rubiginosum]|uniref:Uncharacterized protein n=1 Tax=Hypoxylon rubiginosum TaxID=110542 RepID=A0ACB9ZHC4_9PEZI|nr:hypothetical protein F4820DRAFT_401008 [Hypoxylon rubiginosum]